ncbi:MAG TPA: murein biosynthesis integral membrane protein MurJ [Nitrospinota bacterium]|nr:murein biosynthesis integral membrane protein MurJ [Nitrospinota bacterium]
MKSESEEKIKYNSQKINKEEVIKAAGVVSAATLLSRILGFIRDMVIANVFGAAMITDAFFVAFRIPNLLRRLLGEGTLTAAFIPVFTEYRETGKKDEAWDLTNSLITILILLLISITFLGVIFAPIIVRLIAPGFYNSMDKYTLTVGLTRIMFPYIFFIGLTVMAMGILNSLKHFATPSLAPSILNISMILTALYLSPYTKYPIFALAYGVILGGIGQLIFQIPILLKKGLKYRIKFDWTHPGVKKVGGLMLPSVLGLAVAEINIFVDTLLASLLKEGSVSFLYYGNRLVQFPLGLFGVAMGIAILPMLSITSAKDDIRELKDTLSFALRLVFFVTIPATIGLVILRVPIINVLFQRGEFLASDTYFTAIALLYYSIGLCAFAGVKIVVPAFYSLKDAKTPVKIGIYAMLANIILNLILMVPLKHGGLALATSLSSMLNLGLLVFILRKRLGPLGMKKIINSIIKLSFATVIMGIILASLTHIFFRIDSYFFERLLFLIFSISIAMIAYFLISYLLRSEELLFLFDFIRNKGSGEIAKEP